MSVMYWTYLLSIGLALLGSAHADWYSSSSQLEKLLSVEAFMAEHFGILLKRMEEKQQIVKDFLAEVELAQQNIMESPLYYENPLNGFIDLYRLVHRWWQEVFDNVFFHEEFEQYKQTLADELESPNFEGPSSEDLQGAVLALARLQDTYKLPTAELANSQLKGAKHAGSLNLTASDCFVIGRELYERQQHAHAVEWLLQAKLRNTQPEQRLPHVSDAKILEYLAMSLHATGHYKLACKVNQQILELEPKNELALQNKQHYARKLVLQRSISPAVRAASQPPATANKTVLIDLYQRVCRGELRQQPRQLRRLHCRYTDNGVAYRRLAPFKLEQLSVEPFAVYYHDVIHDSEMQHLMTYGKSHVVRSLVGGRNESTVSEGRTSKTCWLNYEQHAWLDSLKLRLEHITGLSVETAEPLQLVNYGIGGQYEPHYDFVKNATQEFPIKGDRMLTALFYLNDVELGGGTAFPYMRLLVPAIKGSLLMWYNSHGSLHKDFRTVHAGCPVLKGNKWICNEWFHEAAQEFKRPCGLTLDSHKSAAYKDY